MLATIGVGYIIVKTQTFFFPTHSKIFIDFIHCEMLSVTEINNLINTDKVSVLLQLIFWKRIQMNKI